MIKTPQNIWNGFVFDCFLLDQIKCLQQKYKYAER